ncbi:hypothetical protein [Halopiger xanaduensis]|uniref:Uncharacterized protein n=1 Tax=Halopiger xanaduensis (strain DSM 18323 / JCM 14033 / SH-6) TaxID=797210 RepID=F8D7K0_HALXS|nr:hypothetical protein [Halopiger xanaduensis]AEH36373.1 hypothetical protein Halxa_1745 [Halopiger xanaduensis SH-6]
MTTLTIAMTTAITLLKVLRTLRVGASTSTSAGADARGRRKLARTLRGGLRERLRTLVPIVLALAVIGIGTIVYAELVFVLLEYAE